MVYCVKGSRKVEENKYYPFLTIKRLQDVVMDADEGCFSAVTQTYLHYNNAASTPKSSCYT